MSISESASATHVDCFPFHLHPLLPLHIRIFSLAVCGVWDRRFLLRGLVLQRIDQDYCELKQVKTIGDPRVDMVCHWLRRFKRFGLRFGQAFVHIKGVRILVEVIHTSSIGASQRGSGRDRLFLVCTLLSKFRVLSLSSDLRACFNT